MVGSNLGKGKRGEGFSYYPPGTKDVFSICHLDSLGALSKFAVQTVRQHRPDLRVDLTDRGTANASYDPVSKTIQIHATNIWNTIVSNVIHKNLTWQETVQMIMLHEVGHADPRAAHIYGPNYSSSVDSLNKKSVRLQEKVAYLFGKDLIPDYLQPAFSLDNYGSFTEYLDDNEKRLLKLYHIKYQIQNHLRYPDEFEEEMYNELCSCLYPN